MSVSGLPSTLPPDRAMPLPSGQTYGTFSDDPAADSHEENIILLQAINNFSPRRRRSRGCLCFCVLPLLVAFVAWVLLLALFWRPPFSCIGDYPLISPPNRIVSQDWSAFQNQSWAVGFDLTAGYATSSIAFNNGTLVDVINRPQESKYNDVLARVSREESRHPTPPYYNCSAIRQDVGRQWKRWWRRSRRMPSSGDVEALGSTLLRLKTDTNAWLREMGMDEMQVVFVTVPMLPAMYMEDLIDATTLVGLQLLTLPWGVHGGAYTAHLPVTEINTALAGMGLGLDGIFPSEKKPEAWSLNIFSVLFTKKALMAQVSPIGRASGFNAMEGIANFSLGFEAMDSMGSETYWHAVRGALRAALNPGEDYLHRGQELGRVIVHGEEAENDVFQRILREEVEAAQRSNDEDKQPQFWSVNPVYAASRGAAIFGNWCQRGLGRNWYACFPDIRPDGPPWF